MIHLDRSNSLASPVTMDIKSNSNPKASLSPSHSENWTERIQLSEPNPILYVSTNLSEFQ